MEESIDSQAYVKEETPDNLIYISEHSEQTIYRCLSKRLSQGKFYTFAGPILISLNNEKSSETFSAKTQDAYTEGTAKEPHLYAISARVYKALQESKKNQVISLLGYSGAGKTFAAIHLLDHLAHQAAFDTALFPILHSAMQIIHVMGSISNSDNSESTVCGMIVNLSLDSRFKIAGASIKAKLLDYSLPFTQTGKSYHVLHSLTSASKTQLQSLGLSTCSNFKIFNCQTPTPSESAANSQNFERFIRNLNFLKFTRSDIQEILELLSCVVLLFEINFVGNSFIIAGGEEYTEWTPRHRTAIQRICKHLSVSEDKFLLIFQGLQHKSAVENKVRELARAIYNIAFEWMVFKINSKLKVYSGNLIDKRLQLVKKIQQKDELEKISGVFGIAIVDFPGFHRSTTIGGFCSNLAFECLNLFSADKLIGLLHALNTDKVNMKIISQPLSKELISILMSKEAGLLQSLDIDNFDRYWKDFRTSYKENNFLTPCLNSLLVKYTWGEIEYDIFALRQEALRFIHPSEFNSFFARCSNKLVQKLINTSEFSLSNTFRKDLSLLLEPLISYENSLIYFIKSNKQNLNYAETIRLLRNSLVFPCLFWHWYGYEHWISNKKLMSDLEADCSPSQIVSFINTLLSQTLAEDDFVVGLHYTMFKDQAFKNLMEKSTNEKLKITAGATYKQIPHNLMRKTVRATSSKLLGMPNGLFEYKVYGQMPDLGSGMHEFLDNVADIDEMSFKLENVSHISSRISICSSQSTYKDTLQTVRSKKHFNSLKGSLSNFRLYNHDESVYKIILIQKIWRGFLARRYYKAYLLLNSKAKKIQSLWKAYRAKKKYIDILIKIKKIQKAYKKHYWKKVSAAKVIQKWYKSLPKKKGIEEISSLVSSIKCIENHLDRLSRPIERKSKIPIPKETFKPNILDYSRTLAKQREAKLASEVLPVEKRLELIEMMKNSKLDELRKQKIEQEKTHIKLTPQINKSHEFSNNFLQRQELKSQQMKMKIELEQRKKQSEELSTLTFRPKLKSSKSSKSIERSVQDLHVWAELKKAELSKAQKAKVDEEARSLSPFRMSSTSKKILKQREDKMNLAYKALNEYKDTLMPYWPNKPNLDS